jgi:ubiquinone/menaquinone biosynthesis C-methylase UbiE
MQLLHSSFDYLLTFDRGSLALEYYWHRKRREVLRQIQKYVEASPGPWTFVDAGCGQGIDLFLIWKLLHEMRPEARFYGLEADPFAIAMCDEKRRHYQANEVEMVLRDVNGRLPFSDSSVDFLYCSEVLEHLQDPDALLMEFRRVLKRDGSLLLTSPNEPNVLQRSFWNRRRREAIRTEALEKAKTVIFEDGRSVRLFGHISLRTIREWERALSHAGFRLAECSRGALWYTPPVKHESAFAFQFTIETLLDLLPVRLVRHLSDQWIGLYIPEAGKELVH